MPEKEIMKVPEVAKLLGCNPTKVRMHIKSGIWKFGEYIPKERTGKTKDSYIIYRKKFYKHIGEKK